MMEISLFPLNLVLFPGMPLQLHIFEERYKVMINECVEQEKPFGIVLIESGTAELGPLAKPRQVGCTAQITQLQRLAFGRMNIVVVGKERFRINQLHKNRPYLTGQVEMLPLQQGDPAEMLASSRSLRALLKKYLRIFENAGKLPAEARRLPQDPTALMYLAAAILQTENERKQRILETATAAGMMDQLVDTYRQEVALLNAMLSPPAIEQNDNTNFSMN